MKHKRKQSVYLCSLLYLLLLIFVNRIVSTVHEHQGSSTNVIMIITYAALDLISFS